MYDTYTRYIYEWLINNRIADKISSILDTTDNILNAIVIFGFTYILFKFLKKEWLSY